MTTESRLATDSSVAWPSAPFRAKALVKAVLLVTALAGTLDIIAAHLHIWYATGRYPATLFKGIAGGAFGRERAFQGGAEMVAAGVFFHYFISFAFTLLYFLLVPRLSLLRRNTWAAGTAYATCVWLVMNYVVLRLSALPWRAPNLANIHTYIGWVVITLVFGLPIAFGAERFYKQQRERKSE